MLGRLLTLLALCFAGTALAADKLTLSFPTAGQRTAWLHVDWPSRDPGDQAVSGDAKLELPTQGADAKAIVYVLDGASGNLARKPLREAGAAWSPTEAEFKWIGRVRVRVEHKGQPVASAKVVLNDGARRQAQLLAPSDNGEVVFWAVRPGMVRLKATYKVGGEERQTPVTAIEMKLVRDRAEAYAVIPVVDEVETVTPPAKAAPETATNAASPRDSRNPLGSVVTLILSLAIGAGALYGAFRWMQANRDRVEAKLKGLGVEIPDARATPPNPDPLAMPAKPAPPEQILLDPAAPAPVTTAASPGPPKLVSDAGVALQIAEGVTRVGRESGLELSLPSEATVSRTHAELRRAGSKVVLVDLGSTNGTFVNGARISSETPLHPGDQVQFGALRFRFEE